jgi:DNA-binding NarL/FixJ family response regulator
MQQKNQSQAVHSILIAARSGRMRDSLCSLLSILPDIHVVGCADNSRSAQQLTTALRPTLILMDANLPGEDTSTILQWIKKHDCPPCCLVLVDTQEQYRDATAAGADVALLKGYATRELFAAIRSLTNKPDT